MCSQIMEVPAFLVVLLVLLAVGYVPVFIALLSRNRHAKRLEMTITRCPFPLAMFTPTPDMRMVIANQAWMDLHGHKRPWQDAVGERHYDTNPTVDRNDHWKDKHVLTSQHGKTFYSHDDQIDNIPLFWKLWQVCKRGFIAMGALSLTAQSVEALRKGAAQMEPSTLPPNITPATQTELRLVSSMIEDTQHLRTIMQGYGDGGLRDQ